MGINRNKVLSAARKQVRKRNWKKALRKYRELVDDDPSDVRSMLKIADLYAKMGRDEEALDSYRSVARHYADDELLQKAVAVYKQALRLASDQPDLHRDLGDAYHRLGRLKDAVRSFHKAQKIFKRQGDAAAQRELLERMVRLDPDDIGMRIQLAERYAKDDQVERSLELFDDAAEMLDEEGRIDEFVQVAERIIFLRDEDLELRRRVVDIYLRRGENKQALKHLQACFKKRPDDPSILELLIEAFRRLERFEKAVLVMHELADLYRRQNRLQEVTRVYEQLLELDPDDQKARAFVAERRQLDDSGAMTGRRDTGPIEHRNQTPTDSQEVDALDGVEFLDEEPDEDLEVVPIEEPVGPESAPAPSAEAHPPAEAGDPSHAGHPEADLGEAADISEAIEVIEQVDPTEDQAPDDTEKKVAESLRETDVFIQYGLYEKAYETIVAVIAKHPDSLQARDQMKKLQLARDNPEGAVDELLEMARITRAHPDHAQEFLTRALDLTDDPARIEEAAETFGLAFDRDEPAYVLEEVSVAEVSTDEAEAEQIPAAELEEADQLEEVSAVELDVSEVEFVDAEVEDDDDFEEIDSADIELELIENTDAEVEQLDADDLEVVDGAGLDDLEQVEDLELDGGDFADADFVDMDVDVDELGELSDEEMVALEDDAADDPEEFDLSLTEEEADQMFDDLFGESQQSGTQADEPLDLGDDDSKGELAEVDFYLQQGLVEEAEEALTELATQNPSHPGIDERAERIEQMRDETPASDNPFGARSLSKKFVPDAEHGLGEPSFGLHEAAVHNSNIELGTAYRDMGLLDEAIEEFEQALDDPDAAPAATYHIAMCEIEKGEHDAATDRLEDLLDEEGLTDHLRQAARDALAEVSA